MTNFYQKHKKKIFLSFVLFYWASFIFMGYMFFSVSSKKMNSNFEENNKTHQEELKKEERKQESNSEEEYSIQQEKTHPPKEEEPTTLPLSENREEKEEGNQEPILLPDQQVLAYFNDQEQKVVEEKPGAIETIKNIATTIDQFLFHDGKIYGITFSELKTNTKLQILKTTLAIDRKISQYFPTIKENIMNLKEKVVVKYLELTNKICNNQEILCEQARQDFKTMKENFNITFSYLKNLVTTGSAIIKEWYQSTK